MGNPNPSPETRFKPGQSGNPGGKTPEQRQREIRSAEKAAKLRELMLDAMLEKMEAGVDIEDVKGEYTRFLKESEERGFGAPKQEIDASVATIVRNTNYESKPDD